MPLMLSKTRPATAVQTAMSIALATLALAASTDRFANAQDAVQWRVEDGGNGHWYAAVPIGEFSSPEDMESAAEDVGAHLASIADAPEDAFVLGIAIVANANSALLGAIEVVSGDPAGFIWLDGTPWDYTNWDTATGQPDDDGAGDYLCYYQITGPGKKWGDVAFEDGLHSHVMFEWSADCNEDGIVDYGQILNGTITDCDGNFIPDECELNDIASFTESRTPSSVADFIEFDVSPMSDAADAVTLEISAVGDLATTSEFMFVYLDDMQIGLAFVATGASCSAVTETLSIPAADWNAAGADGSRLVRISGVNIAPDACTESSTSIRVVVPEPITDCDGNGTWDACDIASGDAGDIDGNGVPDSCDPDCDGDGEPDGYEIATGQDLDCNGNLVPDACDVADDGGSSDVDSDGVPDECQPDCDGDGLPDSWELSEGLAMDCNANGHPDNCDIAEGTSNDVDSNGTPDECKDDCNGNGLPDYWEILKGQVEDCDGNGIPDACDIAAGTLADCDLDGRWDECAIDDGSVTDCNGNRVPDTCDIEGGTDEDDNGNGTPDACEIAQGDLNLDGCIDAGDLGLLIALWGLQDPPFGDLNGDGTISAADLGLLIGNWTPGCP